MTEIPNVIRLNLLLVAIVAGMFLIGLFFDRFVYKKFKKIAKRTKWKGDEIIVQSLRRKFSLWFPLAGLYVGIYYLFPDLVISNILCKAVLAVFILSATLVCGEIAGGFISLYSERVKSIFPSTSLLANLAKGLILFFGILFILQVFGISITPLLTAFGIGGLAVALALQDTLANLFSGLHIVLSRQIRPGDYVKLSTGEKGYVTDINWRNTTIRQLPNNMVVIPNSKLASAIITNYHLPEKELAVKVEVGVSYDSDLEKVEKVTIDVAKEVLKNIPGGVPNFEPFIRYHTFGESSINFTVILRAKEFVDQYLIKHEFIKKLHKRYKKEKIVIPFPIRTVYLQNSKRASNKL